MMCPEDVRGDLTSSWWSILVGLDVALVDELARKLAAATDLALASVTRSGAMSGTEHADRDCDRAPRLITNDIGTTSASDSLI